METSTKPWVKATLAIGIVCLCIVSVCIWARAQAKSVLPANLESPSSQTYPIAPAPDESEDLSQTYPLEPPPTAERTLVIPTDRAVGITNTGRIIEVPQEVIDYVNQVLEEHGHFTSPGHIPEGLPVAPEILYTPPAFTAQPFSPDADSSCVLMKGVILYVEHYQNGKTVIDFGEIVEGGKHINSVGRVSFADDCEFLININGQEEEASSDDLAVGQTADIYVTEILESYPWQSTISKIVITSPDPQVSLKPVSTFLDPEFEGVITSIEELKTNYPLYRIHICITSSPNYPDLEEASFSIQNSALIWQEIPDGYHPIDVKDLAIGQSVSILLNAWYMLELDLTVYSAFEIIVLSGG
jgi:hypothetical protein